MLETLALFLIIFGVIGMFFSYSVASLLSAIIVVSMLMLLSSSFPKNNRSDKG